MNKSVDCIRSNAVFIVFRHYLTFKECLRKKCIKPYYYYYCTVHIFLRNFTYSVLIFIWLFIGIKRRSKVPGVMITQYVEELPEGKSTPDFTRKPIALTIQEGRKLAKSSAEIYRNINQIQFKH